MENPEKSFNSICRVCLSHSKVETMVSLTDDSDENGLSPYGITYEKLTKISVHQNPYLPMKICFKCKQSLETVATFMLTSEVSDKKLAKLINFSLKQNLEANMVKEVVHQYTLFSQNGPEESKPSFSQATFHSDKDIHTFSEKHNMTKMESKYPKIKVEIEVQQMPSDSDSADCTIDIDKSLENIPPSDSDNVDIFLYSIEKLITTKVEDLTQIKKEIRRKKYLKEKKVPEQDLTCNVCKRVLANPATYKHHMERHGICRYVCDQCGKGFPVLAELTQHQIYRHGIGSIFECDQCSFKAVRRAELIEHIRLHTGERPFTCEKCGLTFRRKAIYRNHLLSHGEKTVSCDYCPRKFYRRSEMLSHSNNIHDRVYVFSCKVCNVTYAMAKTVRRHMLVKHGIARNMQGKVIRINRNTDTTHSKFFKEGQEGAVEYTDL